MIGPTHLGEEESRLVAVSSLRLARGSLKLAGYIRFTICGSSRKCDFASVCSLGSLTNNCISPLHRDLTTRKETRQKAWEVDGWAETVSKVRGPRLSVVDGKINVVNANRLHCSQIDGCLHFDTAPLVSVEVDNLRTIPILLHHRTVYQIVVPVRSSAQYIRPKREPMRTDVRHDLRS
jgi:hypothetical protein